MTATQPDLPAIDWTDICSNTGPLHDPPADPAEWRDLRGQGLRPIDLYAMTDVPVKGSYL
jgi:hypothetical protein